MRVEFLHAWELGIVSPEDCVSAVGEAQAMSRLGIDVVLTRSSAVSSKGEFPLSVRSCVGEWFISIKLINV
jgi:hypothetical protein